MLTARQLLNYIRWEWGNGIGVLVIHVDLDEQLKNKLSSVKICSVIICRCMEAAPVVTR